MVGKPSPWDPWDVGIDKGFGKRTETLSLWRPLVPSVKERSPKDGLVVTTGRWDATEGTWYLRQSAVLEVIYKGLNYKSPL